MKRPQYYYLELRDYLHLCFYEKGHSTAKVAQALGLGEQTIRGYFPSLRKDFGPLYTRKKKMTRRSLLSVPVALSTAMAVKAACLEGQECVGLVQGWSGTFEWVNALEPRHVQLTVEALGPLSQQSQGQIIGWLPPWIRPAKQIIVVGVSGFTPTAFFIQPSGAVGFWSPAPVGNAMFHETFEVA